MIKESLGDLVSLELGLRPLLFETLKTVFVRDNSVALRNQTFSLDDGGNLGGLPSLLKSRWDLDVIVLQRLLD